MRFFFEIWFGLYLCVSILILTHIFFVCVDDIYLLVLYFCGHPSTPCFRGWRYRMVGGNHAYDSLYLYLYMHKCFV